MKYFLFAFTLTAILFSSCKDEDSNCKTCNLSDPIFSIDIESRFCQSGDNVIVTAKVLGVSSDSTYLNTTVEELVMEQELAGATCE